MVSVYQYPALFHDNAQATDAKAVGYLGLVVYARFAAAVQLYAALRQRSLELRRSPRRASVMWDVPFAARYNISRYGIISKGKLKGATASFDLCN